MKTILFLTYGDADKPSTWSNVPYLLTKAFEKKKGIKVIKVDMSTKNNIFTLMFNFIMLIIKPSSTFYFYRTKLNRKIVEKRIKKIVEKYDDQVDLYFCISYDFSPSKYTNKKVLLFSDWPIEYAIEERFKRNPDKLEMKDILRHKSVIEDADYRISLFQDCANYMNNRFNVETKYLGGLINGFEKAEDFKSLANRNKITFIGKKSYYEAAVKLIEAFENIDNDVILNKNLELHIIGMKKSDFKKINNDRIIFHGYLDKGDEIQRQKYYDILKTTIVVVNTTDMWAGMSSVMESMYYYRPIITSKTVEFVKTFGNNINFGYYCSNNSNEIKKCLLNIINMSESDYKKMINNAHNEVKDNTYDLYVDKVLQLIKKDG